MEQLVGLGVSLATILILSANILFVWSNQSSQFNIQSEAINYNKAKIAEQAAINYVNKNKATINNYFINQFKTNNNSCSSTPNYAISSSQLAPYLPTSNTANLNTSLSVSGSPFSATVYPVAPENSVASCIYQQAGLIFINGVNLVGSSIYLPDLYSTSMLGSYSNELFDYVNLSNYQTIQTPSSLVSNMFYINSQNGAQSFTVPANITTLYLTGCGAGGGGIGGGTASSANAGSINISGTDGSSGSCVERQAITVTPGDVLTITPGTGGTGGSGSNFGGFQTAGTAGTATIVYDTTTSTRLYCITGGESGSVNNLSNALLATGDNAMTAFYSNGLSATAQTDTTCGGSSSRTVSYYPEWMEWSAQGNQSGMSPINGLASGGGSWGFAYTPTINNESSPYTPSSVLKWSVRMPALKSNSFNDLSEFPAQLISDFGVNGTDSSGLPATFSCYSSLVGSGSANSCPSTPSLSLNTEYDPYQSQYKVDATGNPHQVLENDSNINYNLIYLNTPHPSQGGRGGLSGVYNSENASNGVNGWLLIEW